jgi:hypothetical protein
MRRTDESRGVFQFYPMVNLWYDIQSALQANPCLVHLIEVPPFETSKPIPALIDSPTVGGTCDVAPQVFCSKPVSAD